MRSFRRTMSASKLHFFRALSVLICIGLLLLIAWGLLSEKPSRPSVNVIDNSEEMAAVLEQRDQGADHSPLATAQGTWPRMLVREPLDEETAALFFPALKTRCVFDPFVYVRHPGNVDRKQVFAEYSEGGWRVQTNTEGLREDNEILDVQPDVRIVVAGDSHTDGLCPNAMSFPNVLERSLALERPDAVVEVLNTGTGAYNFYNYLGVLERFSHLKPDLWVVAAYGGNDFYKNLSLLRYFEKMPPPNKRTFKLQGLTKNGGDLRGAIPQELGQVAYFLDNPDDVELAIDAACSISVEMQRLADAGGSKLLFVYLPPPFATQPQFYGEEMERVLASMGLEGAAVDVSDRIADAWLDFLSQSNMACIDLRPAFRSMEDPLYWFTDHHLNMDGQRYLAGSIEPLVKSLL